MTPDLIYKYQMHPKTLNDVLKVDMDAMKKFNQPFLVNDQLGQLYLDLELGGFGTELVLEDGITSSGSESGSSNGNWTESQVRKINKKELRDLFKKNIFYITRSVFLFCFFYLAQAEKNGEVRQTGNDP